MPDDLTPPFSDSLLAHPYPQTTDLLIYYYEHHCLPPDLTVSPAALLAACDRLLAHPDLPPAWRDDVLAIRSVCLATPKTTSRRRP